MVFAIWVMVCGYAQVKFSAQVVLDLDLPFFKAGVEFMTPTLLAPILTRCCKDEIAQIAYWMSMVPAEVCLLWKRRWRVNQQKYAVFVSRMMVLLAG